MLSTYIIIFTWCRNEIHGILLAMMEASHRTHWKHYVDMIPHIGDELATSFSTWTNGLIGQLRSITSALSFIYHHTDILLDIAENYAIAMSSEYFDESTSSLVKALVSAANSILCNSLEAVASSYRTFLALTALFLHGLSSMPTAKTEHIHIVKVFTVAFTALLAISRLFRMIYHTLGFHRLNLRR
ncbi:hypothetical protein J3E73DRAFT_368556 [Bipolaris maydis]|nr:hypothetical protein J3E73DRAFT_368556 [Bipolaris maydis]